MNMALIISSDEIKKTLPNYAPEKAEEFQSVSTKRADKEFESALHKNSGPKVILMSGGSASGKSEFIASHLENEECIIFDGTLATKEGAKIKIRKILKSGKKPILFAVIPDDLKRAFIAFLNRDRKFNDAHFYKTHSGSRSVLLWVAHEFPDLEINIIESSYTKNDLLQFAKINFKNRIDLLEYLTTIQKTESDIISYINRL